MSIVPLGAVQMMETAGAFGGIARTKSAIVADGQTALSLVINRGPTPLMIIQAGREFLMEAGGASLFSEAVPGRFDTPGRVEAITLRIPRTALAGVSRNPEDLVARAIPSATESLRMLASYSRTMMEIGGIEDPQTAAMTGGHIIDLIGLSAGAIGDAERQARQGGLRAGRLHTLLGEIKANFHDPGFSIHQVARKHRVTPRYLQDLLQETGQGFGERVLEMRLALASDLIAKAHVGARKVSDIAFSCGFNDVSYFHRCFRKRFGMTPADARAA